MSDVRIVQWSASIAINRRFNLKNLVQRALAIGKRDCSQPRESQGGLLYVYPSPLPGKQHVSKETHRAGEWKAVETNNNCRNSYLVCESISSACSFSVSASSSLLRCSTCWRSFVTLSTSRDNWWTRDSSSLMTIDCNQSQIHNRLRSEFALQRPCHYVCYPTSQYVECILHEIACTADRFLTTFPGSPGNVNNCGENQSQLTQLMSELTDIWTVKMTNPEWNIAYCRFCQLVVVGLHLSQLFVSLIHQFLKCNRMAFLQVVFLLFIRHSHVMHLHGRHNGQL